ncbi:MFS transporter [Paenibacillus kandeliae]|uniref:MFS transporter n=1 Tax=Paenibacillus kandeliae TaxID=3231269 RepID=UPI003459C876
MQMIESSTLQKESRYVWITWLLSWSGLIVMCSLYVTLPLNSLFSSEFDVSVSRAALTSSLFSFCFACGCLVYGAIADKYGRKKVVLLGLTFLAVFTCAAGWVHSFPLLLLLRGLQGLAASTFSPVVLAYIVSIFPQHRRVTAIGFVSTGFLMAGVVGQVIAGIISTQYNWHGLFLLFGGLYIVTAGLILIFLPNDSAQQPELNVYAYVKQIKTILIQKDLLLSYVVAFVLLSSFIVMYTILNHYLQQSLYALDVQSILEIKIAGIAGMLLSPFAGKMVQKTNARCTLLLGLTVSIVSLVMMALWTALAGIILFSVVFVAGIAISVPALVAIVGQLGLQRRGIAVSLYTFILFAGTAFAPYWAMQILSFSNGSPAFIGNAVLLLPALLAVLVIRIPKL